MASTPEMRVLALCLPGAHANIRELTSQLPSLNWASLLKSAKWQGVMPLLASHLLPSGVQAKADPAVPSFALAELRSYQERHLLRSVTQTAALVELQCQFDRSSLTILPWKGTSVGVLLYGSATLRESVDLDFLFLKTDIQQVLQITRRLGYRLLGSSDSESKDLYILALQREFTFGRERDQVVLEFHLQVLPSRFSLWQDTQADIQRASTVCPLAHVDLRMQSPEDLLVSLCAHATKHNWDRLKWSCDIAQFLNRYGDTIDWTQLLTRLHRERKDSVVLLGLAMAAKLFNLKLPSGISEALQRFPRIGPLADALAVHLMTGSTDRIAVRHRKAIIALLCPRLRDRIAYTLRPIVELNYEDLYVPVHNRMFFFMNYAFRVVRLLRKYGPQRLTTKTAASVRSVR